MQGRTFGRLTVIKRVPAPKNDTGYWWLCRCVCGTIHRAAGFLLRKGSTRSCGCLRREVAAAVQRKRMTRHGHTKHNQKPTGEYRAWVEMRQRCLNTNKGGYAGYGGRGIRICRRWSRFENFLADMGSRPTTKHSLDRKNNEKGYTPSNCRWATARQQQRNKRDTRRVTLFGVTKPLIAWAEHYKIHPHTVAWRLDYGGWSVKRALTTAVEQRHGR
jgi:hypothetical protein